MHVTQVKLSVKDIEDVLNTLIYDGKVTDTTRIGSSGSHSGDSKMYRVLRPLVPATGLMRVPCGICPVSTLLFFSDNSPLHKLFEPSRHWLVTVKFYSPANFTNSTSHSQNKTKKTKKNYQFTVLGSQS